MTASNLKKEIINDWSSNFTGLSFYAQNKLYKVCGACILGIEIISLPRSDDYRPIFVVYPLWKTGIKRCLEEPIFMQEIYNKKGFQFNIPYTEHTSFITEAVECTKSQAQILDFEEISIKQLFETIDKQFSQTLIKSSPVGQAKLYETKFFSALYVNDMGTVEQVWNEIQTISKSWRPNLFEWKFGKLDIWIQNLQIVMSKRSEFLRQIEENKLDKKITQLKSYDLTV